MWHDIVDAMPRILIDMMQKIIYKAWDIWRFQISLQDTYDDPSGK